MTNYKTINYAAIDLSEMLRQLEAGEEPDMEQFFCSGHLIIWSRSLDGVARQR